MNTAKALRLAGRPEGVTITQLAQACEITRGAAYKILKQLEEGGELVRERKPPGREPHIFRLVHLP